MLFNLTGVQPPESCLKSTSTLIFKSSSWSSPCQFDLLINTPFCSLVILNLPYVCSCLSFTYGKPSSILTSLLSLTAVIPFSRASRNTYSPDSFVENAATCLLKLIKKYNYHLHLQAILLDPCIHLRSHIKSTRLWVISQILPNHHLQLSLSCN
jgi:hypothetical protein